MGESAPSTLREVVKATPTSTPTTGGAVNFTAELTSSEEKSGIYIVANFDVRLDAGTSFAEVKTALKTADLTISDGKITAVPSVHPMISNLSEANSITKTFSLGTTENPVKLYRNTVKVNASTKDLLATSSFVLESISLYNAPVAGYVFPEMDESKTLLRYNYAENLIQTWNGESKTTGDILCYEAPMQADVTADKKPFVILKGKYDGHDGYYRCDFVQTTGVTVVELALLRNCIFTFNIKNVERAGYSTIEEAILNTAGNAIKYNVFVEDLFSTEMVSNGEQYLGVSNSEIVVHSDHDVAAANVLAVTVSYTTKATWTNPGKISYSNGITPLSGTVLPLPQGRSPNIRQDMDVYISLSDEVTTGKLVFSIGDLRKEVTVRRSKLPAGTPMTYNGGYVELTHQEETQNKPILLAEILNPHLNTWVRLATSEDRGVARSKIVLKHGLDGQPTEKLYVHVWGNEEAIYTHDSNPKGYFYISYANDHGRTRYCVIKEVTEVSFDANGGYDQPGNMYQWVRLSADNDKAFIVLPQDEPQHTEYNFKGWTKSKDGSGTVYLPNTLYTTTFGATDRLYAKWEAKPVLKGFVLMNGLYWAKGNLILNGDNSAKAGASNVPGLMFKYGSLIGFDRDSKQPVLKPTGYSSNPSVTNTDGDGFILPTNAFPNTDDPNAGTGDPCRYYLGPGWRTPTRAEYLALGGFIDGEQHVLQTETSGTNETGDKSTLSLYRAMIYRDGGGWGFGVNTMYRTSDIQFPFGFTNLDRIIGVNGISGGENWDNNASLGAVRCVTTTDPNR